MGTALNLLWLLIHKVFSLFLQAVFLPGMTNQVLAINLLLNSLCQCSHLMSVSRQPMFYMCNLV